MTDAKQIRLVRYDDGEFILLMNSEQVGPVLSNSEAREVKERLQRGTFDLDLFTASAGVV